LSSFLGASGVAMRPTSAFLILECVVFVPGWRFRFVFLRAKEKPLRLGELDRSWRGAAASGSSGFERLGILRVFWQDNFRIEQP
jgi:hypothetical protein